MCHVSCVTCHLSPVMCHLSHVQIFFLNHFYIKERKEKNIKKINKVVKLFGGGTVIKGAYPV